MHDSPSAGTDSSGPVVDLRVLIEHIPDIVLVHRLGKILYVNQSCADTLGYASSDDFVGRSMLDFIHPDDRAETVRRVERMAKTGQSLGRREFRLLHRDGQVLFVELAPVRRIDLPDGAASLAVVRDRTQQKRIQERLMATDRLASLGGLAASLTHELSNPLTYVMGNLAVIADGLEALERGGQHSHEVAELRRAAADARVGAVRVRDLLADLKVFSRPDVGMRDQLDLRKVLDSAINLASPDIRRRARLVRDYGPAPAVFGVESKVALAFYHLLTNAADAIDVGEIVEHAVEVGLSTDGEGWAVVEIRDTGRGLTDEVRSRMWEPFFTTHPRGRGAGLGLPVVRSVVVTFGGEIHVEDRPKGGTIFRVRLPPIEASDVIPAPPSREEADGEIRYGRILVVDDEPIIGSLVRRALAQHEVYIVSSGRDALELLEALEFDVLVCDLVMPDIGGGAVYEALKDRRPELAERIIFMTAGPFGAEDRHFIRSIPNPVLDKPFESADLNAHVQAVLRRIDRS